MASVLFKDVLIVVRGGGDLASGAIYRLQRAGFPVVITELAVPRLVRRTVCYGEAARSGSVSVERLTARRVPVEDAAALALDGEAIPLVIDATKASIDRLKPAVVVDGRMEKIALDTRPDDAPLVIALGPGYTAGEHCHAVIETNRGHNLGRVIWRGSAEPDTGSPKTVEGQNHTRVLRAPADGHIQPRARIGDEIASGQVIATINGREIIAPFRGMLRGLVTPELAVTTGMKIGDLDPRIERANCFTISDKSLAIGGGVVEAVLSAPQIRKYLLKAADHETSSGV
jgi:xanthine dehydrogenase accessory factor